MIHEALGRGISQENRMPNDEKKQGEPSSVLPPAVEDRKEAEVDEEPPQPINLDRYMHGRRRTSALSWAHLFGLLVMLFTLVMLFLYKDRCSKAVSDMVFIGNQPGTVPAARIKQGPESDRKAKLLPKGGQGVEAGAPPPSR